jgi:hypothetical protein
MPDPADHAGVLAWLLAYRAEQAIPTPDYDAIPSENERLRRSDAERRAMREGQHLSAQRRVNPLPRPVLFTQHLPVVEPAPVPPGEYDLKLVLYSALAPRAIQAHKAGGLRLYVVLQRQARQNCGRAWYSQVEIIALYEQLGMTAKQARHDLSQARGLFVAYMGQDRQDRRGKRYRMIAKERVLLALDAERPGPAVLLPDAALSGSLDTFCAFAYSAYLTGNRAKLTREKLCELFGVTRPTLYEWERLASIDVRPQYLRARPPTNEAESAEYAANFGDGGPIWHEVDHQAKVIRFKRQTINQYTPTRTGCAPGGRSKRLKRRIRSMGATHSPECVPVRRLSATRQFDGRGGTDRQRIQQAQQDADKWQAKHTDRPVRTYGGSQHPVPRRHHPRGVVYDLAYSPFARHFDVENARHRRELEGAWRGIYDQ